MGITDLMIVYSLFCLLNHSQGYQKPDRELNIQHTLTHNKSCEIQGTQANCSSLGLEKIPSYLPSNITILDLSNNKIEEIPPNALVSYPSLLTLDISRNRIRTVHNQSFSNLTQLKYLDVSFNLHLYLSNLSLALWELQHSDLETFKMESIVYPYSSGIRVRSEFAKSLPRNIKTLVASNNWMEWVGKNVLKHLPKNLTYLDVSDNKFSFGGYLSQLDKLKNLETLKLNKGTESFSLPTTIPTLEDDEDRPNEEPIHEDQKIQNYSSPSKLPPNLKNVEIQYAGWSFSFTEFHIHPDNSLESLDLRGNNIPSLVGPVTGFEKLKKLVLFNCNIKKVSERFFDNFPALETLNLSTNAFGYSVLRNNSRPIFKKLYNLTDLDLSFTDIATVDRKVFEGLANLERLHLERNIMYYFNANISHMTKLQFVNFSNTELSCLRPIVTDTFVQLIKHNPNFTIDFSETPIHCFCANFVFIKWMIEHSSIFTNRNRYKCVYDDTSEKYLTDFNETYRMLQRECADNYEVFILVSSIMCLTVSAVIGAICYRFRWKLKYLYYSAYLYYKDKDKTKPSEKEFKFDVFLSYAHEDEDFIVNTLSPSLQALGVRLHIHGLNFAVGQYISINIVEAVQSSRYTMFVLTNNLLASKWCKFEIEMANMESVHTGRNLLVFLLVGELKKEDMSTQLLYHIKNNTYIQYPDNVEDMSRMNMFWRKLATDLKS